MSWLTWGPGGPPGHTAPNSYLTTTPVDAAFANAVAADLRTWGGQVDAGGNNLINLGNLYVTGRILSQDWNQMHHGSSSWTWAIGPFYSYDRIDFSATQDGFTTHHPALSIGRNGVGVGTSAPQGKFGVELACPAENTDYLLAQFGYGHTPGIGLEVFQRWTQDGINVRFKNAGYEVLAFVYERCGVNTGTVIPPGILAVNNAGNDRNDHIALCYGADAHRAVRIGRNNAGGTLEIETYDSTALAVRFKTRAAANALTIDDAGRVALGAVPSVARLSLGALVDDNIFHIYDSGAGARLGFGVASGEFRMYANATTALCFGSHNGSAFTEHLRLTGDGYLIQHVWPAVAADGLMGNSAGYLFADESAKGIYMRFKDSGGVVRSVLLGSWI
ncbi:MAG: hypothetical protein ACE15B_19535 [Bryobacteraceae bacterium]